MDDNATPPENNLPPSEEDLAVDVMLQVLMIQARTAAMLLGQAPHPSTGQRITNLPRSKILIDQLETAATQVSKLSLEENQMLKDTIHQLRLAYVQKSGAEETETPSEKSKPSEVTAKAQSASPSVDKSDIAAEASNTNEDEEPARKRFVKKYD